MYVYIIGNSKQIYPNTTYGGVWGVIDYILLRRESDLQPKDFTKQKSSQSAADELKKFKELLDMGIITQEEFEAKKKQLLNL